MVWLDSYQLGSFGSRRVWEEKQPLHKKVKTQACPTKWATAGGPFLAFPPAASSCQTEPLNLETEKQCIQMTHKMPSLSTGDFTKSWPSRKV